MAGPLSRSFWMESASWWSSHPRAQRKASQLGVGPAVEKDAQWTGGGARSTIGAVVRASEKQGQLITVGPELAKTVAKLQAAVIPALQAAFDRHLGGLAQRAFAKWPVSSGLSKAMLSLEYTASADRLVFTGRIRSRAPYTWFIKGQPHEQLVYSPADRVVDAIGGDTLDGVVKAVKR